ncbi:hypothetical protein [Parendozoicomonas haliclonae]|uniref:Uncharacterized protein n=1 Tax=Parendozoicomonas haliclonae TaxID=1960125 RepID=A0A1X7AG92_9GAMM|nr:hypothetical protein [Parendozoicomonas haliclonae]SMA37611.1 hypothetical protein EHSB41UT_00768 [Parendozoicomonas haliclonae]
MLFLEAWIITVSLECPLLLAMLHRQGPWQRIVFAGIAATSLTIPWLWFILPAWLSGHWFLIIGESLVVIIEALVLSSWLRISKLRGFIAALLANLFSYWAGVWLQTL